MSDLRIVLVGKTGSGKSATGNTILRKKVFKEDMCAESVTRHCEKHSRDLNMRSIDVIDTPGIFDTEMTEEELKNEIERCIIMSIPGPHVFLLVIPIGLKYTEEERNTVKWIQKNFGDNSSMYTIVLFTHGDLLEKKTIEEFCKKNEALQSVLNQCGRRYYVFNNKEKNDQTQVIELLRMIDEMVDGNGGKHFTSELYEEAQAKIKWEERKEWMKQMGTEAAKVAMGIGLGAVGVAALLNPETVGTGLVLGVSALFKRI